MTSRIGTLAALAILSIGAQAGTITTVATRAALGANDLVAWGTPADDTSFPASPYARTSNGGLNLTASATALAIFQQNGLAYVGNFVDGEMLLNSGLDEGPITINFASPVSGVGFNIQHLNFGAFTAQIAFYGAGNVLFGTVTRNGTSNTNNDGSAVFIGGTSSLQDITRIAVSVNTVGGSTGLTINQMSLITDIPEPSTVTLVSFAAAGLLYFRRRQNR